MESTYSLRLLALAVNRQGVVFLWPIKLPDPNGKTNSWNLSAFEACGKAQTDWIRVSANMSLGAYDASEAIGCHLALGWDLPERVLDLFAEFRCLTNGQTVLTGPNLAGALIAYKLDPLAALQSPPKRRLILRKLRDSEGSLRACDSTVASLADLLSAMLADLDFPRALHRGRYMVAVARMEWAGVPDRR